MKVNLFLVSLGICFLSSLILNCSKTEKNYLHESQKDFDSRMEWWRDARFGMFIHWGIYSVPAGIYKGQDGHAEWIMETAKIPVDEYEKYASQFNPVKFDADEWVKIAKNAGMKYLVITSKHHDGFCMWDSKVSDYDIIDRTPFKRDVLQELADACKKEGIKFCFYHSIMDWHHPNATGENFATYREEYLKPQLKELVKNYGPLGVLWFDGEWITEWTEEQGKELYNFVRNLQPNIIINNRVGKGRAGMQGMNEYEDAAGDFGTPEQEILERSSNYDWESCMTLNDHWGFASYDHHWKSTKMLIHNIVDIAAKGGNYLLNVGPTSEGLIPQPSVERLKEIGDWMKINGEAIYKTRRLKHYKEGDNLLYTIKKDKSKIYAIVLDWPGSELKLKYVVPNAKSKIFMLGVDQPLDWKMDDGLKIQIPEELQNTANRPCKHAFCFRIEGKPADVVEAPTFSVGDDRNIETKLFSEKIEVSIHSATPGAKILYTLDGKTPDDNSPIFSSSISISESTTLKAFAKREGFVSSLVSEARFSLTNLYKNITLKNPASPKYSGLGELTLGDQQRASVEHTDGKWLGFEKEDFEATVDLGKKIPINKITVGCLQNINSWIWLPTEVEFLYSVDGSKFQTIGEITNEISQKESGKFIHDFSYNVSNITAQYIQIKAKNIGMCPDWHQGAGGKAWIFVDEIMVE